MWQPVSNPQTLSGATFKWSWKSEDTTKLRALYHNPKKSNFATKASELYIYDLFGLLQDHFDEEYSGEVDLEALALMLGVEKVANKESTSSSPSPPGDQ